MSTPAVEPQIGDMIVNELGEWRLLARVGSAIRIGRDAANGWWEQDDVIMRFPAYQWDHCPRCGGPASRYSDFAPCFVCCDDSRLSVTDL